MLPNSNSLLAPLEASSRSVPRMGVVLLCDQLCGIICFSFFHFYLTTGEYRVVQFQHAQTDISTETRSFFLSTFIELID